MHSDELISKYPLITDQVDIRELTVILQALENVLERGVAGDVVEFGCYKGTTSLFLQRMLQGRTKRLHVYDSFAGLPEKTAADSSPIGYRFIKGELHATKTGFIQTFKRANLPLPVIHKGWFDELTRKDVPAQVAFAFLDGDYYESIAASLRLIEDALVPGAVIVVDDYMNEALPGAQKAVDEWLKRRNFPLRREASLAVISVTS